MQYERGTQAERFSFKWTFTRIYLKIGVGVVFCWCREGEGSEVGRGAGAIREPFQLYPPLHTISEHMPMWPPACLFRPSWSQTHMGKMMTPFLAEEVTYAVLPFALLKAEVIEVVHQQVGDVGTYATPCTLTDPTSRTCRCTTSIISAFNSAKEGACAPLPRVRRNKLSLWRRGRSFLFIEVSKIFVTEETTQTCRRISRPGYTFYAHLFFFMQPMMRTTFWWEDTQPLPPSTNTLKWSGTHRRFDSATRIRGYPSREKMIPDTWGQTFGLRATEGFIL